MSSRHSVPADIRKAPLGPPTRLDRRQPMLASRQSKRQLQLSCRLLDLLDLTRFVAGELDWGQGGATAGRR